MSPKGRPSKEVKASRNAQDGSKTYLDFVGSWGVVCGDLRFRVVVSPSGNVSMFRDDVAWSAHNIRMAQIGANLSMTIDGNRWQLAKTEGHDVARWTIPALPGVFSIWTREAAKLETDSTSKPSGRPKIHVRFAGQRNTQATGAAVSVEHTYQAGKRVEFWSETHKRWTRTIVKDTRSNGEVLLACRPDWISKSEQAAKLRSIDLQLAAPANAKDADKPAKRHKTVDEDFAKVEQDTKRAKKKRSAVDATSVSLADETCFTPKALAHKAAPAIAVVTEKSFEEKAALQSREFSSRSADKGALLANQLDVREGKSKRNIAKGTFVQSNPSGENGEPLANQPAPGPEKALGLRKDWLRLAVKRNIAKAASVHSERKRDSSSLSAHSSGLSTDKAVHAIHSRDSSSLSAAKGALLANQLDAREDNSKQHIAKETCVQSNSSRENGEYLASQPAPGPEKALGLRKGWLRLAVKRNIAKTTSVHSKRKSELRQNIRKRVLWIPRGASVASHSGFPCVETKCGKSIVNVLTSANVSNFEPDLVIAFSSALQHEASIVLTEAATLDGCSVSESIQHVIERRQNRGSPNLKELYALNLQPIPKVSGDWDWLWDDRGSGRADIPIESGVQAGIQLPSENLLPQTENSMECVTKSMGFAASPACSEMDDDLLKEFARDLTS